uniref:CCHC-type domain-containing protein n=1 Tax=Strigamia maritima TaxID=126957 RepID=T1IYC3_STRMM
MMQKYATCIVKNLLPYSLGKNGMPDNSKFDQGAGKFEFSGMPDKTADVNLHQTKTINSRLFTTHQQAKLDRTNYVQWCVDVQLLLEEKGIWSFALGKQEAIASAQEKLKSAKDREKSRAIILQSLVPRLQPAAMKCDTIQAVWQHLKKQFEPSSIAREASLVETLYGIRRLENEELDTFVSRLEKPEDDLIAANVKLKPEDQIKAYILLSHVRKDFELQIQSIYQWQKDNFTYEKVLEALLLENNRRKLVAVSEKSSEAVQAFSTKSKVTDSKSSADGSYLQKITCFKCNQQGHFARDCAKFECHISRQCPDGYAPRGVRPFRGRSRGRSSRRGGNTPGQPSSNVTSAWFAKVVDSGPVSVHPMVCSAKVNGASDDWFLDSCAYHHVCDNRKLFSEFAEVKPMQLELGQDTSTITRCGTIELLVHVNGHESAIDLKNVYFVEGFKRNLIAIGKIDQAGKLDSGLYRVQGAIQYRKSNKKELSSATCGLEAHTTSKVENVCENAQLWHKHFAYVDVNGLKKLNDLTRMSVTSKNEVVTSKPLELIRIGTWGPTKTNWAFPLKHSDQMLPIFQKFHLRVEKLSGFKVKSVNLENGKQLMTLAFQNYLNQAGILVKSEENNNQKYFQRNRYAKIFVAELVLSVTYLLNRYPNLYIKRQIPYVLWRDHTLSMGLIRVLGSLVSAKNPRSHDDVGTFKKSYLVGYAMRKMGYRVWDPNSNYMIYKLNKVVCNEQELFGNTRKTGNIQTEGNQEVEAYHDPGVSSDSEDDDITPSAPITKQVSVKTDDVNNQSTSTIML